MNKWLNNIHNLFFPSTCLLCGAPGMRQWDLCEPCYRSLPGNHTPCALCAIPLSADSVVDAVCGHCLQDPPPFRQCIAPWRYEPPIDFLVLRLKFNKDLVFARLMAQLLANRLMDHYKNKKQIPQVILPVPLHAQRLRERGFNQAVEIARVISSMLHIPTDITACARPKMTLAQAELHANERKRNVKNAFTYTPSIPVQHVAIVDDVMTTGHTARELVKTIQKNRDIKVDVWVCARANYR